MYCQSIKCYDSSHCIIQRKYYFSIKYYYSKKYYYSNKCYYSNKYYENKKSIIKSEKYFCCFWRAIELSAIWLPYFPFKVFKQIYQMLTQS